MLRKVWQYSKSYNILRYYVDFTTKHLFSSLEISGLENIPKDGMIMYAPNHCPIRHIQKSEGSRYSAVPQNPAYSKRKRRTGRGSEQFQHF